MRASVAPSVANSAYRGVYPEPPLSTGGLSERGLLGVASTNRETVSGVHRSGALPGGKRRVIGHEAHGDGTQVGRVGAPGRAFSVPLGAVNRPLALDNQRTFTSVNANAVAAPQQANKGRPGRQAEQWSKVLGPEPDDDKVVAALS